MCFFLFSVHSSFAFDSRLLYIAFAFFCYILIAASKVYVWLLDTNIITGNQSTLILKKCIAQTIHWAKTIIPSMKTCIKAYWIKKISGLFFLVWLKNDVANLKEMTWIFNIHIHWFKENAHKDSSWPAFYWMEAQTKSSIFVLLDIIGLFFSADIVVALFNFRRLLWARDVNTTEKRAIFLLHHNNFFASS